MEKHIQLLAKIKVWWQDAILFVYFSYFITYIHSSDHIHTILYIYPPPFAEASLHLLIALSSVGKTSCGAESRIKLGPAFQQADALPTEPRRTVAKIYVGRK
jgi:hypothetical protein